MSIRGLVDKWLKLSDLAVDEKLARSHKTRALELQDELPVWTEITDDPDTWPTTAERVMSYYDRNDTYVSDHSPFIQLYQIGAHNWNYWHSIGLWWRPLCDLDMP